MNNGNTTVVKERSIADRIKAHQRKLAMLREERVASLPRITTEEREVICAAERAVTVDAETAKEVQDLRSDRQFTDEDKDQIAAAKIAHRLAINTAETRAEAARAVEKAYLSAFKLTLRKDGKMAVRVSGVI